MGCHPCIGDRSWSPSIAKLRGHNEPLRHSTGLVYIFHHP